MPAVEEPFRTAVACHQAGDVRRAAELYRQVLQAQPDHAGAWHLLGVTCHQQGDYAAAERHIRTAVRLDPGRAVYHNNLGAALKEQGRLAEAEAAYRRALALRSDYADALANLAVACGERAAYPEAVELFERVLALPLGQGPSPANRASTHNNLGNALLALRRPAAALAQYEQAIALAPDLAEAHANLGAAHAELGRTGPAERCFAEAARLRPDRPLWRWKGLGLCPPLFAAAAELQAYRTRLEGRLDACLADPPPADWRTLPTDAAIPSFHLAHHGACNRQLLEKFARLYQRYFPPPAWPPPGGKPRIGFVVTRGHEGGFLRGLGGVVERLDPARFEVALLCSQGVLDRCRQAIRRADVHWVGFADRLDRAAEAVAVARCDLLYHWQVGTDPLNYFLPLARLAPRQCTGWGSHGTTGMTAIDDYLSSGLVEGPDADGQFTERLVRLATLPTFERRPPPAAPARRSAFGLPDGGHLYGCLQRLAKFHPDADRLFGAILEQDPDGYLVLLDGGPDSAGPLLRQRLAAALGGRAARVLYLPPQPPAEYRRLLGLLDVVLDLPTYSGGLTAYDAFGLGLPVVTLPGWLGVTRYTLGCYRRMGLEALAAASEAAYVALAVRLGRDRDYRQAVRAEIGRRSAVLFEDAQAVTEHERFFAAAVAAA